MSVEYLKYVGIIALILSGSCAAHRKLWLSLPLAALGGYLIG